jgi:hypothetical protein
MNNPFISIPETCLPGGLTVPAFSVAAYLSTAGAINPAGAPCKRIGDRQPRQAEVTQDGYPWTNINYHNARKACEAAGFKLITESQWLAIAWLIYQQDINWTGGKVGEGSLLQGLRKDSVDCAMPANFEPQDADERPWHQLPSGDRIYHFSGNAFSLVFDDIQGDKAGLIAQAFASDTLSLMAPHPSLEKGIGWRPNAGADWSGNALLRGGSWNSERYAGAFGLYSDWPGYEWGGIGFRCTNPGL